MMRTLAAVVMGLGLAPMAMAQDMESDPVKWEVQSSAKEVAPGGKLTVKLTANLEPGWHIYSITQGEGGPNPTTISLQEKQPFKLAGKITSDKPHSSFDENFGIQVEQHEDTVNFTVPVSAAKDASGSQEIKVDATYQACTSSVCLPPQTAELLVPVTVKK